MAKELFTPEAGISIIEQSLKQSNNQKTGAFRFYIIWGTVLFIYFIIQFLGFYFKNNMGSTLINYSSLLFIVGGLLSFMQSKKDDKTETVVPLNEKIYTYAWIGASVALGVLCIIQMTHIHETICMGVLLIFGLVNFIIGGITKFTPLIVGGLVSMMLGMVMPHLTLEYKFLTVAIGVLSSCLIPGLLMRNTNAHV